MSGACALFIFLSDVFMFCTALKSVLCCKCQSDFSSGLKPLAAVWLYGNKKNLNFDNFVDRRWGNIFL